MDTLISSLIVAALSGLAFLAYRHPRAFKPVHRLIKYLGASIFIGIAIWNSALSYAYVKVIPFLVKDGGALKSAEVAINSLAVPFGITLFTYLALTIFLIFLEALPNLIGTEHQAKSDKDDDTKT